MTVRGAGLLAFCLVWRALAAEAEARPGARPDPPPRRAGFTMEFGIGLGAIQVGQLNQYGRERVDSGFEPHAISLGGFVSDDVAILGRWKSTYHTSPNSAGQDAHRFLGTLALHVQWWFEPRWFVAGGLGLATFGYGIGSDEDDPAWSYGGAAAARVGYAFYQTRHHALKLSLEAVVGVFADGVALGETLCLEWQYY